MAASLVQQASGTGTTTSVTATLATTPKKGNLLVVSVTANVASASVTISGFTQAVTIALAAGISSNQIFYKISDGTETTTISATGTLATLMQMHAYEFSGFNTDTATVLDQTASVADSTLTVTSRSSGTTGTTANADELVFVSIAMSTTNGGGLSWTNSYTAGVVTTSLATAYTTPIVTGAQSTTASWTTLALSSGCIATFKASSGNVHARNRS